MKLRDLSEVLRLLPLKTQKTIHSMPLFLLPSPLYYIIFYRDYYKPYYFCIYPVIYLKII